MFQLPHGHTTNVHLSSGTGDWRQVNVGLRTDGTWPLSVTSRAINNTEIFQLHSNTNNEIADAQLSDFQCQGVRKKEENGRGRLNLSKPMLIYANLGSFAGQRMDTHSK